DLGHLLRVYREIEFGDTGVIHILTDQGRELLEWRPEGLVLTPQTHDLPSFASLQRRYGTITTEIYNDGEPYLTSYSKVTHFPVTMVVSRSISEILKPISQARSQAILILSILTLIVGAATALVARSISHNGKLFMALEASSR